MAEFSTLAAVDLGSNSFHCQVGRVVGDQVYPLDSLREPVRLGAGLTKDKRIDEDTQERALACLKRFGERLRDFDRHAVRAVGTNTLRVAKNAGTFLKKAEAALGFPIEVVAGREEARLIYLGVSHDLPASREKRLVVDIGGGSTELVIGTGYRPQKLESLFMGCVSYSLRFFEDGKITKGAMKQAELAARNELQPIVAKFARGNWQQAVGSSGTVRALSEVIQMNGFGDDAITPAGLDRLRSYLIKEGNMDKVGLPPWCVHEMRLAEPDAAIEEEGIERHGSVGADLRLGDATRRGMRQLVRLADDEILESEARIERRADVFLVRGNRRFRAPAAPPAPRRSAATRPRSNIDRGDARILGIPERADAVGVMRCNPIAQKPRRDRDFDAARLDPLQCHVAQPAAIGGIAKLAPQLRPNACPLGLDLVAWPQ